MKSNVRPRRSFAPSACPRRSKGTREDTAARHVYEVSCTRDYSIHIMSVLENESDQTQMAGALCHSGSVSALKQNSFVSKQRAGRDVQSGARGRPGEPWGCRRRTMGRDRDSCLPQAGDCWHRVQSAWSTGVLTVKCNLL